MTDLSKIDKPKSERSFRCTLHDINFSAEVDSDQSHKVRCPLCLDGENFQLRQELDRVKSHRDTLIRAIEIKQTVIPLTKDGETEI